MAHKSRASRKTTGKAPAIRIDEPVYTYTPEQMAKAARESAAMAKDAREGRRVNKEAGDLRVRRVMHTVHYHNAIAAGEDPRHDEGYMRDMVKRGCVHEVAIIKDSISSKPFTERGRYEFDRIFSKAGTTR